MDKREFAEQVITEVRSLSISSVLSSRMDLQNRYGYAKGLCPFHNDGKIGSFVVTDKKSIFKCFSCGVGGDSVKFVALLENINYLESAFKLAVEYNIISSAEYEEYFERKRYTKDFVGRIERKYSEIDKKSMENEIADEETLNIAFSTFIETCSLTEEHKKHLMEERHLSEEEIKTGLYFTFPTRKRMPAISAQLKSAFCDAQLDVLQKVPGFYKNLSDGLWTFAYHKGIGIGIKNADGKVVGIQIRHDKKDEDKSRYVWFSSSFASLDDKFEYGTSSGSPIDVVYPTVLKNRNVIITEGRFKAEQIAKNVGSIAISVQGVGNWRGIVKELDRIADSSITKNTPKSPELEKLIVNNKFEINTVLLAFDADMNYKVQVFEQARKMTDALEKVEDGKYPVYYLNWNEDLGKGIDDIIVSGHMSAIKKYDKSLWDKKYEEMILDVLRHEQENIFELMKEKQPRTTIHDYNKLIREFLDGKSWTILKHIPVEMVKTYFHKFFDDFSPVPKGKFSIKHMEKIRKLQAS